MRCKSCNSILSDEERQTCWPLESVKKISYIDICFNCIKQTDLASFFFTHDELNDDLIHEDELNGDEDTMS